MAIKKTKTGWQVDIQPGGRGAKRIRKTFKTQAEAKRFENFAAAEIAKNPAWNPKPQDKRRLKDLIARWHELHGNTLKDGKRVRDALDRMADAMNNPVAALFTAKEFADYRAKRIDTNNKDRVSFNTVNHEQAYLSAVFNELKRFNEWDLPNPLAGMRKLKIDERELAFLTKEQIDALFQELKNSRNPDAETVVEICLKTGARWSEAETLRREQVQNGQIRFHKTKSGKARSVPIDEDLEKRLLARGPGRLFSPCYDAFRKAIERAQIELPDGQMTHVLRHSFASHFMMNGGNILTLQKILGHSTLAMTIRYAHLAPNYLDEARRLNPLSA